MAARARVWAPDWPELPGCPRDPVVQLRFSGTHDVERLLWLLDNGVTDLVQAALGWRWAVSCLLTQLDVLGLLPPPVLVEAMDSMLAAGMALIVQETRKTAEPEHAMPEEGP